jgi:serine/threonine protein kinase
MDYYEGGDLHNLLKVKGQLSEDEARFYLTEVVLALKYLHDQNILYRDLKVADAYDSLRIL